MIDNKFKKPAPVKPKISTKRLCVYCKKPIKKFSKWKDHPNRKVHRKCWLKNRGWESRHLDYLFTEKDIKKEYQSVRPTGNHSQQSPPPLPPTQTKKD